MPSNPHSVENRRRLPGLVISAALAACIPGAAFATDYLFTSNTHGGGATGRRLTMSTKTVGPYTDVPCRSAEATVDWSPDGASWGIARDKDMATDDYLWASISSTDPADCGAGSDECVGAAYYDLSAGTVTRSFSSSWNETSAKVPDIVANNPAVVVVDKRTGGKIVQWNASSGSGPISTSSYDELSQLDWVNTSYFAGTEAGSTTTTCGDSSLGSLVIGKVTQAAQVGSATVTAPAGAPGNATTKPEGVSVADVDGAHSASCASGTTDVIYVVDWCQSQLIAYSIDTTDVTPTPVEEGRVDLDADSGLSGDCNPSSVTWYPDTGDVYVLCQTRNTILRIDTSTDQCDPTWADDEARLNYYNSGSGPRCDATPTIQAC